MGAHNQGWGPGDARRVPRLSMPCTSCNGVRVEGAKTLEDVLRECIICVLLPLYCHSAIKHSSLAFVQKVTSPKCALRAPRCTLVKWGADMH